MFCRFFIPLREQKVTHFCYFHNTPFHTHYLLLPATLRLLDLCNRIHRQVRGIVVLLQLQIPLIPAYFLCISRNKKIHLCVSYGRVHFRDRSLLFIGLFILSHFCACLSDLQHFHKLLQQSKNRIRLSYPALAFHFLFFAYFCLTKYGLHQHHINTVPPPMLSNVLFFHLCNATMNSIAISSGSP